MSSTDPAVSARGAGACCWAGGLVSRIADVGLVLIACAVSVEGAWVRCLDVSAGISAGLLSAGRSRFFAGRFRWTGRCLNTILNTMRLQPSDKQTLDPS